MIARIFINEIEIGSIPSEKFYQVKSEIYKNKANYFRQFIITCWATFNIFGLAILAVPFFGLLWFVVSAIFFPQNITDFFVVIQSNTPTENSYMIIAFIKLMYFFGVCIATFLAITKMIDFGHKNTFKYFLKKRIQKDLAISEEVKQNRMTIKIENQKDIYL